MELDEALKVLTYHQQSYRIIWHQSTSVRNSTLAILQRALEEILASISKTQCILDDIILTGLTDKHYEKFSLALNRLVQHGLREDRDKCIF